MIKSKLKINNSLSGETEVFRPIQEGHVGMYVCGPTVYSDVHIGNIATFVRFDMVYRYLLSLGYKVKYIRNITDVGHLLDDGEDRMSKGARIDGIDPMELAHKYTIGFHKMMDLFNVKSPSIEPRATGHIPEQIKMISQIIDNGLAYIVNGSVYFDTVKLNRKANVYGKLSGWDMERSLSGTRQLNNQSEKRNPSDFALWIKAQGDHIMKWDSPWSVGFPGWHLECSAMSTKYLGKTFDIHGGGNDLKFPHHENEIAQNYGSCGCKPANYWIHTNMLLLNGQKMSKSDGNTITPTQLMNGHSPHISKGYSPMVLRYFILQSHYSSTLNLTDRALQACEKSYHRLMSTYSLIDSLESTIGIGKGDEIIGGLIDMIYFHMNNDFNTPRAIANIFDLTHHINTHNNSANKDYIGVGTLSYLKSSLGHILLDIFGFKKDIPQSKSNLVINDLMNLILDIRSGARERKDWEISDKIRDKLELTGINVQDNGDTSSWNYK